MENGLIEIEDTSENDNLLKFSKISVKEDYLKKWNETSSDFICLTRNGELISDNLYRIGGLGPREPKRDGYFMLLKYVEAYYSKDILKMSGNKDPKYLQSRWVILDKHGNEKVEFDQFKHPYLVKDSVIYHYENGYYNIETGEHYCDSYEKVESKDYLFLENKYDDDKSKRGVMKINKKEGTWELFPE